MKTPRHFEILNPWELPRSRRRGDSRNDARAQLRRAHLRMFGESGTRAVEPAAVNRAKARRRERRGKR